MVDRQTGPLRRLTSHIPTNKAQLERELKGVLKLAFWAALLAPVVIVPFYYLLLSILR